MDRGDPLGEEGDALRRHGLAGEVIRVACALLVVVPAGEDVAVHARRRGGGCVGFAGDIRSEFDALGLLLAAVYEDEVIAVAGVEEFRVVIRSTVSGSFLIGKTGNIVLIFLRNSIPCSGAGILVMKFIIDPILGHINGFARKDLYIVIGCLTAACSLRPVEFGTAQRHGLDVDLIRPLQTIDYGIIRISRPCSAAVLRRPLITDVCAILGCDTNISVFFPSPVTIKELHLVLVALVIDFYDGGAVAHDGLLRDGLGSEAIIAVCSRVGLRTSSAGLRFGINGGVAVIVCVLLHVQDGVLHVALCDPVCVDSAGVSDLGEVRWLHAVRIQIPAAEGVAGLGRIRRRLVRGIREELRSDVAAAVGFEGQPVAGRNDGVKDVDLIAVCNRFHSVALSVVPAGHGLIGTDRVGHVGRLNRIALAEGLAVDHALIILVHEQDVLDFVEVGEDLDSSGLRNSDRLGKVEGIRFALNVPAEELAFAVRRGRLGQILAIFDDLLINFRAADIEGIGRPMRCIRADHPCRHRIHRRDCRNHSGNHYDSKQQCKYSFLHNFPLLM